MLLKKNAKLVLEDGSIFYGYSFASEISKSGEVVFSTGMVGYPESLTDPSYKGQILCMTYPLIGNYGIPSNEKDSYKLLKNFESNKIHVQGLIISDYSFNYSHWNAKKSLAEWLKEHKIPGIYGIDTRELTKKIREKGAMLGKIVIDDDDVKLYDPNKVDLVKEEKTTIKSLLNKFMEQSLQTLVSVVAKHSDHLISWIENISGFKRKIHHMIAGIVFSISGIVLLGFGAGLYLANTFPALENGLSYMLIGIVLLLIAIVYTKFSE